MVDTLRVPPDSTGKKLSIETRGVLDFDNLTGSFFVGDTVTGANSGATGEITAIVSEGYATTAGRLYLANPSGTFINDEDLDVSAAPQAVADLSTQPYEVINAQHTIISDPDNPSQKQKIDRFGATFNTFTDGSPVFSPFGAMIVGQQQPIKNYRFAYGNQTNDFWDQETSGATISWEANPSTILFSTPTTSGALASRTSNFYHPYVPGVGNIIEMTIDVGDPGKTNVRRRWGLFDDDNGVFFELDGTDFGVVIRSNTTGSVVDTKISQANFNLDRLDGSDAIGFDLDLETANIYWIDYQWLGAGRVRFGIIDPQGARITAHTFENANTTNLPYMRTGTLPLRIEQENTGTAGSSSELRWSCASVKHTSKISIEPQLHSTDTTATVADTDGEVPILAARPKTTLGGRDNRTLIRLNSAELLNITSDNIGAIYRFYLLADDSQLTNESFSAHSADSAVEIDTSATAFASSHLVGTFGVGTNQNKRIQLNQTATYESEIHLNADGTTQPIFLVTVEIVGTGSSNAYIGLNWGEIHL